MIMVKAKGKKGESFGDLIYDSVRLVAAIIKALEENENIGAKRAGGFLKKCIADGSFADWVKTYTDSDATIEYMGKSTSAGWSLMQHMLQERNKNAVDRKP